MSRKAHKKFPCPVCLSKSDNEIICSECNSMIFDPSGGGGESKTIDGTVLLSEVVSVEHDRIKAGFCALWSGSPKVDPELSEFLQQGFGQGLPRTSTTLLAGGPGAGKSTLLLGVCDDVLSEISEGEALYIAAEEALEDIKARADRLKLKNIHRIRMFPAMSGEGDLPSAIKTRKPVLVILDSLQGFSGTDMTEMEPLCHDLQLVASELRCPIIIVCQVTKGDDFAGPKSVQHAVGVLATLDVNEEFGEDVREWEILKNRYGKAFCSTYLVMTSEGFRFPEEDEFEEDGEEDEGYSDE